MKKQCEHTSKILQKKKELLISDFIHGKAPDLTEQNARLIDDYFCESFEKSMTGPRMAINKNPYAIIALGGYGREEQCVHSDVDILFLFGKNVPSEAEELIQEVVYPLWDVGFHVGHATRSLDECISLADKDIEVLTSLLDARFVCGISFLYTTVMEKLRKKVILKNPDKLITKLIEKNRERHEHFGDSAYLLEPNLKEGKGGLRDYHTVMWIAQIKANVSMLKDLEYHGCLSNYEYETLTDALGFIWFVRNHLHYLLGKKYDRLHFEYQEKLAQAMNFNKKSGQQPVERFLGKLHEQMEFIKQYHQMAIYELENAKKYKGNKVARKTKTENLENRKGMLYFVSSEEILNFPDLMIKIFEESARLKIPLGTEAKRLVRDFLYLVDKNFRKSASVVKTFERILVTPAPKFNVLNEMLNTGFLVKFIPEFKQIVNRIQYDEYHLYPVDKHVLHTVQTIKKFGTSEDPSKNRLCENLYEELCTGSLSDRSLLLWAALLHDIGKGEPGGGHSQKGEKIVRKILKEKGYRPEHVETVAFLVREHLLLANTAARRDINDEETAIFCASKIQDTRLLKMLYLLTVADSASTGPKAWNNWNSDLLTNLFLKVLNILEKGELATNEAVDLLQKKKIDVMDITVISYQETALLFEVMSPRYLLYTPTPEILEHISLYKKLGTRNFVWKITREHDLDTRTVTICAKDAPGLMSKIAGVFTLNNIDILNVRIYTWRNNIALDVFTVKPPPDRIFEDEKWEKAGKNLESALSGSLDIAAKLKSKTTSYESFKPRTLERSHEIIVDNDSSSFFTIVEVYTYDFPGLLFRITDALFKCRLNIWFAKIATKVDQIVDIFYVRDFDGEKADSLDQTEAIKAAVEKVLPDRIGN
ncbi:MAG: [protein-PII] uridylyltransferase [Desulfobacterales bacterium]|nr:[protein-PII] uridylyltransferase [Desulfobacterales bacterium]